MAGQHVHGRARIAVPYARGIVACAGHKPRGGGGGELHAEHSGLMARQCGRAAGDGAHAERVAGLEVDGRLFAQVAALQGRVVDEGGGGVGGGVFGVCNGVENLLVVLGVLVSLRSSRTARSARSGRAQSIHSG